MRKLYYLAALFVICLAGCNKKEQHFERVTGTIIGYYNDWSLAYLLVQVDRRFPIGETLNSSTRGFCTAVYRDGELTFSDDVFRNVIRIQPRLHLLLPDWPTTEVEVEIDDGTRVFKTPVLDKTITGKRIAFSYRKLQEDDFVLFFPLGESFPVVTVCHSPRLPIFTITDIQILN